MSLRALGGPLPARVEVAADGAPGAVDVDGRRREVAAVRDDWLVQDLWWTRRPVDRHYYEVVLESGRLAVMYRDARDGGWFVHR
jgi:hypothetical protein